MINSDYLTKTTGDPFTDTGGYVIQYLQQQDQWKGKPILELIEYMAGIYVYQWGAGINSIFLNSTITQASFKGEQKIQETVKYFRALIDGTEDHEMGFCRITGQNTQLYKGGRENYMMAGSGAFLNFHHSFDEGLRLSKEVIIRLFFVPFGVCQIGGMVAIITSNIEAISQQYVAENCAKNISEIGMNLGTGVLKYEVSNPVNALFHFAEKCIVNLKSITKSSEDGELAPQKESTINLFHFTNFAAAPDIELRTLPADVFAFYTFCQSIKVRKDWNRFVRAHYRNAKYSNARFNMETESWETPKEVFTQEEYKNWRNGILHRLLNGKSIIRLFAKWVQKNRIDFAIVKKYLIKIKNMDKKTVEKIQSLSQYVVEHDKDFVAKAIRQLDGCKGAYALRKVICKWNGDNAKDGNAPLITVDDYANYLFADSANWSETRDVLIIAIYENAYKKQILLDVELSEGDNEE